MNIALIVLCVVFAVCPVALSVTAMIYGKIKLSRAVRPIEFYPPRGYSPIDFFIKFYGHKRNARELVNPIMLYWASRGFIKIEEDCRRGLKLTKLNDIQPQNAVRMTNGQKQNFRAEKKLFDNLFQTGNVFYTLAAESSYTDDIKSFVSACRSSAKTAKTKISKRLTIASYIVSFVSLIAVTLIVGLSIGDAIFALMIFPIIAIGAFNTVPNDEGLASLIKYPFFAVWGGVPFGVFLSSVSATVAILLSSALVSSAITVTIIAKRIDIRTDKSAEIYGRIRAFKTFLLDAEIDRLLTMYNLHPHNYTVALKRLGL